MPGLAYGEKPYQSPLLIITALEVIIVTGSQADPSRTRLAHFVSTRLPQPNN